MEIHPKPHYIKRVPLTIGLLLVSGLGFIAALDFNNLINDYLFAHITGNGSHNNSLGFMFGGCTSYLFVGLVAILAIVLIWRGIAEWPIQQIDN